MDAISPISNPQRLLPGPGRHGPARPGETPESAAQAPGKAGAPRPAVWTLPRETAAAACAAQFIAPQRRGLKADASERARYRQAYAGQRAAPMGLMLQETA